MFFVQKFASVSILVTDLIIYPLEVCLALNLLHRGFWWWATLKRILTRGMKGIPQAPFVSNNNYCRVTRAAAPKGLAHARTDQQQQLFNCS